MKAVLVEIPEAARHWMQERAALGHDRHDEMWDGVLHMVPPPTFGHQGRGADLIELFAPLARERGLKATYETGVFRPGRVDDYRQPDIVISHRDYVSTRGVEGRAELVVEIRSPGDESWEKLPFFAEMGIPEVLIFETDEPVLLRLNESMHGYDRAAVDADGFVTINAIPVRLRATADGNIEIRTPHETRIL